MVFKWFKSNDEKSQHVVSPPESPDVKNPTETYYREVSDEESLSSSATSHIFQDPKVAEYYRNVYEEAGYECRSHFDPKYTWTPEEERKVVWKCDLRVTFWAYIMFTALDFDRANIAQALSDNMLNDLKLTTNDYNLASTINLICFLGAELPSQLISKKLGAEIWIPTQLCLWSAVSVAQAGISTKAGFYVTRALIGLFQGGFICDTCLWMSYFYTSKEFPFRLSLFYIANPLTNILSALLGFALIRVQTSLLPHGWQWVFLIEGIFTFLVGIISYFMMPSSAIHTKTWYRKKGWFTDHEEKIVVNRVLRDDPTKGDMNNRQPVSVKELFLSFTDFDLLPIYIVRFLGDLMTTPVSNYMTLTLRQLGFSKFNTNLLTIPYNVLSIITMLFSGWISEKVHSRSLVLSVTAIWCFACLIPLRFWPGSQVDVWQTYSLLTVLLGRSPFWPLSISWCSANSNSVRARAVSSALVNIFSQAAGIVGSNIYRSDDKPLYHRGNSWLVGISAATFVSCIATRQYYIWRNKQKDKAWNKLTTEQQHEYRENSTDVGNRRLDFRFVY
jgi:sugar phosphate permease